MQLNLKDPETNALVTRLSQVTGLSKARAVKEAVKARLAELEAARTVGIDRRLAELRDITAAWRARLPQPLLTQKQLDDWMYDDHGAPR